MESLCIIVFTGLTLYRGIRAVTLADRQVSVTLHTYMKDWNNALVVCQAHGGSLYEDDSNERHAVLEANTNTPLARNLWIGLHQESGEFVWWTDCEPLGSGYDAWKPGEPKTSKQCAVERKTHLNWQTIGCDTQEHFVCQTLSGSCTFEQYAGNTVKLGVILNSVGYSGPDINTCRAMCLNQIYNNLNCWATEMTIPSTCTLYYTSDPFVLDAASSRVTSSTDLWVKRCYTFTTIEVEDPSIAEITPSSYPTISNCHPTTPSITDTTTQSTLQTTTTIESTSQPATTTTIESTSQPATTTPTVTSSTATTVSTSSYSKPCSCQCSSLPTEDPIWTNLSLNEKLEEIVKRLLVDKEKLSSTRRKRTSMPDNRSASKSVGYVAAVLIGGIFGIIALSDVTNFILRFAQTHPARVEHRESSTD